MGMANINTYARIYIGTCPVPMLDICAQLKVTLHTYTPEDMVS